MYSTEPPPPPQPPIPAEITLFDVGFDVVFDDIGTCCLGWNGGVGLRYYIKLDVYR